MSGRGVITSRDERVAEVDDRLQQPPLVPLDQPLLFAGFEIRVRRRRPASSSLLFLRGDQPLAAGRSSAGGPAPPEIGDIARATTSNGGSSASEHRLGIAPHDDRRQQVLADEDVDRDAREQRRRSTRRSAPNGRSAPRAGPSRARRSGRAAAAPARTAGSDRRGRSRARSSRPRSAIRRSDSCISALNAVSMVPT